MFCFVLSLTKKTESNSGSPDQTAHLAGSGMDFLGVFDGIFYILFQILIEHTESKLGGGGIRYLTMGLNCLPMS